jgi:hypothetical protein
LTGKKGQGEWVIFIATEEYLVTNHKRLANTRLNACKYRELAFSQTDLSPEESRFDQRHDSDRQLNERPVRK